MNTCPPLFCASESPSAFCQAKRYWWVWPVRVVCAGINSKPSNQYFYARAAFY